MKLLIKISFVLFIFAARSVFADMDLGTKIMNEDGCLSAAIIKDISNDFKLNLGSLTISDCDTQDITNRMIRALAFLKYGQFKSTEKSKDDFFFNEFQTVKPYEFLQKRIKKINFKSVCPNINATANAPHGGDEFFVCVNSFKKDLESDGMSTPFDFAAIAIHESRHADSDDIGHVTCTQGEQKGISGACDKNRAQKGAYHFGTDYYAYVAKAGLNFHPAIKSYAGAGLLRYLKGKFNEIPKLNTNRIVILKDTISDQLYSISEKKEIRDLKISIAGNLYDRGDGEFNVRESDTNLFSSWSVYDGKSTVAAGRYALEYNEKNTQDRFIDVLYPEGSEENLKTFFIFGNLLKYSTSSNSEDKIINLPFQDSERILHPKFCGSKKGRIYIQTKDQNIFEGTITESDQVTFSKFEGCETGFLNVTNFGKSKIGLTTGGRLMELQGSSWKPVLGFETKKFKFLSNSFDVYDFFMPDGKL